ncbi:MAG: RNA polymerase sigma factor [candidate division KSB1 bacterium]|nr:RNA polymerase sigma factor [candidate division KSB1 bacterium]MDZ7336316.1 RNA polymerase sigma factor [candidate division KSB1 bacterium]MDZ7358717.1 RNA polymerase sigma factor [candidate division KSB1 bacterium]MDZ7377356.1 RNA polymerase sigma factor [candidate division KSB1 bacterium]MDZ7398953.1 RNA polymerase sigma factor [candidate division KSB1 bacterium]
MAATDDQLIQRIYNQDVSAFDELYEKYQTAVYRFACYLTQNRMEADDLFQETWLRAVRFLPNNPSVRDFKAWILTIAINLHRDQLRKKRIRRFFGFERSITIEKIQGIQFKLEL